MNKQRGNYMKMNGNKGFTLIEVIVVAGIIAILAGILVPMIIKEIDASRASRASADARSIMTAVMVFKKDTGQWPVLDGACNPTVTLVKGDGNQPGGLAAKGFDLTTQSSYNDSLAADTGSCFGSKWKGPYMAAVSPDPWGNSYVTNVDVSATPPAPVWVLSAGPNGTIDTDASSSQVAGDDIGIIIQPATPQPLIL